MNDQWRNADAIVDVVSCGLWISHPTYTAVLHASSQPSLPNFWQICSPPAVVQWSLACVLRPIPCDGVAGERATSRYGITLDLKNMDYLVLDDDRHPHSRSVFQYVLITFFSHQLALDFTWGKPPSDEYNCLLYGDVFGVLPKTNDTAVCPA